VRCGQFHYWNLQVARHKSIEFQVSRWPDAQMFDVEYQRRRFDHAGLEICVTVLWHEFRVDFYDHRHFDRRTAHSVQAR